MAVMSSFRQMCPSCEAMISIKETMIGKKVECTKCKDKFIAERPDDEDAEDTPPSKKDTKLQTKKNTPPPPTGSGKSAGKRPKPQDDDSDDDVQAKSSKPKAETNGKSNGKAHPRKAPADDEDDGGTAPKKKEGASSNKLVIGLVLAGVGIVLLIAAGYFFMNGPSQRGGPAPGADANNNKKDKEPNDGGNKGDKQESAAGSLNDAEAARLSNLLPNNTEDVFHVFQNDLFSTNSPLRDAVFQSPGTLDDADLQKKLGFSVLGIDDLICAKKHTAPAWRYTVIHFKDPIKEADLKAALKLTPVKLEGENCYKMTDGNPWFDFLSRFSFGIPNHLRSLDGRARDKPSFIRLHNAQTMIIGDEAPVTEFLKMKGQFKELTPRNQPSTPKTGGAGGDPTPGAMMGGGGPPTPGAMMGGGVAPPTPGGGGVAPPKPGGMGGATAPGLKVGANQPLPTNDHRIAAFVELMNYAASTMPAGETEYFVSFQATPPPPGGIGGGLPNPGGIGGGLPNPGGIGGGLPNPGGIGGGLSNPGGIGGGGGNNNPPPNPAANIRDDMYLTIKPSLKAILDHMELRGIDTKDKVLFSSATDMEASRIETNLPEFKNAVVRRPRQFWDVTIVLTEQKPRIRNLGTALIQKSTLKYQYRNEIQCIQEIDAKEFELELSDRVSQQVAKFIQNLIDHEVRLPKAEKKDTAVSNQKAEDKQDALVSQITVEQKANTVEFVLDLVLDTPALLQIQAIASLSASVMRIEMEAATNLSLRHGLANAGRLLGEKGISQRQVAPGNLPPGAFKREAEKRDIELRAEREPGRRISWMAALLPHMGHETLFNKINFRQSWRDSGNWTAGNTIVPQFLDPAYPDKTRYLGVGDLSLDFAATHFVGIAGVGRDAASYKRGDPATNHLRGPLGYDESASLDEIKKGRGLANVILLIQAPHDGITGVSPWIAGGGATLRGVHETNAIADFVLSTDRYRNVIQPVKVTALSTKDVKTPLGFRYESHEKRIEVGKKFTIDEDSGAIVKTEPSKTATAVYVWQNSRGTITKAEEKEYTGKRGAYVLMTDGSVRFIDQNIDNEVFKAMCTIGAPQLDLEKNPSILKITDPGIKIKAPAPPPEEAPQPPKVDAEKKLPVTKPADNPAPPPVSKKTARANSANQERHQRVAGGEDASVGPQEKPLSNQ